MIIRGSTQKKILYKETIYNMMIKINLKHLQNLNMTIKIIYKNKYKKKHGYLINLTIC